MSLKNEKRSWFGGDLNLLLVDNWETLVALGQSDSDDIEQCFGNFITQKNQTGIPVYFCLEQKKEKPKQQPMSFLFVNPESGCEDDNGFPVYWLCFGLALNGK